MALASASMASTSSTLSGESGTRSAARSSVASTRLPTAKEADSAGEEGLHRHLVGGVQHRGCAAAGGERLSRQAQRRKADFIRRLEGERAQLGQIEPLGRRLHALGQARL